MIFFYLYDINSPRDGDVKTAKLYRRLIPGRRPLYVTQRPRDIPNAGSMLDQRQQRWYNIEPALDHRHNSE